MLGKESGRYMEGMRFELFSWTLFIKSSVNLDRHYAHARAYEHTAQREY